MAPPIHGEVHVCVLQETGENQLDESESLICVEMPDERSRNPTG